MRRIWTEEEAEFHGQHVDFAPIESWPKPLQRPHPPILVGGEGRGILQQVIAYGDEWMPEGRAPVDALRARVDQLQALAADAGRQPIPVTVYAPPPTRERLEQLATIGVHRALLKAPVADASGWHRFLDDAQPLTGTSS